LYGLNIAVRKMKQLTRTAKKLTRKRQMNSSRAPLTFRKTAACPAASTLLSFRSEKLSPEIAALVRKHLTDCEFCEAELRLLAHLKRAGRTPQTPEMPSNLRILAESILCK